MRACVFCLILVHFAASIFAADEKKGPPKPNEGAWSRIDRLNASLKKGAVPLSGDGLIESLTEARSILALQTFYASYQEIRAWAFSNDFSQAEALTKRAAPALMITFDGDSDLYQVSYAYFKSLVGPGSEPEAFLKAYRHYSNVLLTADPSAGGDCQFPFDLSGAEIKDAKAERSKAISKWKSFQKSWKAPALTRFAAQAVRCLSIVK